MSETITFHALDLSGETGLKLYLRKADGSLLNTGGDTFTEPATGMFQTTLTESRTGLGSLAVRVCDGTETADNLLYDGFLPEGSTVIGATVELDSATIASIQNGVVLANSAHGGSGATLTLGAVTITVSGSTPNITLAGSGSGNGIEWTRSGSGDPLDQDIVDQIQDGIGGGGGGDATLAKQEQILTAIQGSTVIQVASPNVQGNLVLTQGDDYDGTANPRASWTVSTDYTDGWSVTLTIRDTDDVVIYTTSGEVVSSTVVAVTIAAPTGLIMTGCPGQWQGKFDVELTKAGSKKTIALGACYINEDQTR